MMFILRLLNTTLVFIVLITYSMISSLIFFFVPRVLRRKKHIRRQRVLITGAGSGVGRALAIEFSKHEACLILVDINKQSLLETKKLIDCSSTVLLYECDITDYKKVYEMADQVHKSVDGVDILVNNAGTVHGKFLWDLSEDNIIKTIEVNLLAQFWTCKAFLPRMMKKNHGHIVSMVSLAGISGSAKLTDYSASKFAAMGFAESLELELYINKLNGIKVTTVCPSVINTNLFKGADIKVGSIMSPEYVAKEVVAGVLENEEMIVLPSYFKLILRAKNLVPRWIGIRLQETLGTITLMDEFVGKEQLENGIDMQDKAIKTE